MAVERAKQAEQKRERLGERETGGVVSVFVRV